ncbi:MAG: DUF2306 domain-containing protein [Pseudomonadota bacterium]
MNHSITTSKPFSLSATQCLHWSGRAWFTVAATGQVAFIAFIALFYGVRIFGGDFAGWNDKPLIDGYKEGDAAGNAMFAAHVLFAAVMTFTGLLQLLPSVRNRFPALHRYSGRTFVVLACLLAAGGLWLTWVRGTMLALIGGLAITLNAVLIFAFAALAVRHAMRREIYQHQRWAMRLFLVANGVWFMRIAMMAWMIMTQSRVGMNNTMSGPVDIVIAFGCYLIPLGLYELYWRTQEGRSEALKVSVSALILCATAVTALGVFGTTAFMWLPHL